MSCQAQGQESWDVVSTRGGRGLSPDADFHAHGAQGWWPGYGLVPPAAVGCQENCTSTHSEVQERGVGQPGAWGPGLRLMGALSVDSAGRTQARSQTILPQNTGPSLTLGSFIRCSLHCNSQARPQGHGASSQVPWGPCHVTASGSL
ncbi:hypothetical protein H1C71_021333 [Ictidomys tridecemlineatus]|nr:hypothetical protein H1C71_021333 [Ictidomys tridecemlineatus]